MKQVVSTLNEPKFPLASKNHTIYKEQMIGEQLSLQPLWQGMGLHMKAEIL